MGKRTPSKSGAKTASGTPCTSLQARAGRFSLHAFLFYQQYSFTYAALFVGFEATPILYGLVGLPRKIFAALWRLEQLYR